MSSRALIISCALTSLLAVTVGCSGERGAGRGAGEREQGPTGRRLGEELVEMARLDQELREDFGPDRTQDTAFMRRMLTSQQLHAARMGEILDEHGWPGPALVGEDGAEAAWLLIQHGDLPLQQRALRLLRASEDPGIPASAIAMLTDRVLVGQGEPQRYGTQFSIVDGRLQLDSLQNPDSVDVWRAEVGLGPLAEYIEQVEAAYGAAAGADTASG
jgi:hypothetical protein